MNTDMDLTLYEDVLKEEIRILNKAVWENKVPETKLNEWLENFCDESLGPLSKQHLHMLYLLSQFMFFGSREIREMLKYIYSHLFRYPIIREIRKNNGDTLDSALLNSKFIEILKKTRFLAIGNPSESGTHLLYYFRQENKIPKDLFINAHEIFRTTREAGVPKLKLCCDAERYIFIDDFCGSGTQAIDYSEKILKELKEQNSKCKLHYYVLFATENGRKNIMQNTVFDKVETVFELDESFQCFSNGSRFFLKSNNEIDKEFAKQMVIHYGKQLRYGPYGFKNGQQMLAFSHNTPDNTLPIFGGIAENGLFWRQIFPRYDKVYGGGQ